MADQTHGAIETLLGVLTTAIKGEVKLQSGIKGDIQFIKDEMDSMNGFLLHLTKSSNDHDDQQRAWMKQVRDIAYVAQDCIELYNMYDDLSLPGKGFSWAVFSYVPNTVKALVKRRKLANRIRELKDRVKDVGERRQRYGVAVPSAEFKRRMDAGNGDDEEDMTKKREEFLQLLLPDEEAARPSSGKKEEASLPSSVLRWISPAPFGKAIRKLPTDLKSDARKIRGALLKLKESPGSKDDVHRRTIAICMGMILRALHALPQRPMVGNTMVELEKLKAAAADGADDLRRRVMLFCYSELSTEEKSCLQYLSAFSLEESISRTSLVRRWAAERLVSDDKEGKKTVEQRAERCFDELLFRGFVSPVARGATGKVKSCVMSDPSVKEFINDISKTENFEGHGLPVHLKNQILIRDKAMTDKKNSKGGPIKKMIKELKALPDTYRLNVMDLGGCRELLQRQNLRRICKMRTIKYLSLRGTDVSHLPHQLQELRLLETLDIRQTMIQNHKRSLYLPKLKHLLAGDIDYPSKLSTVGMPASARRMTNLEILSHVRVSRRHELRKVENLPNLRKLGVLLPGNEGAMKNLRRVIGRLSGCLHSLSISITTPVIDGVELHLHEHDGTFSSPPTNLVSLRIEGMRASGLPNWVESLNQLSKITLCSTLLTAEKLKALGKLPRLACLRLRRGSCKPDTELGFGADGFRALKFLLLEDTAITTVIFQANSAPQLEKIVWSLDAPTASTMASAPGIEHLLGLKQLELKGIPKHSPSTSLEEHVIAKHPKHPAINRT